MPGKKKATKSAAHLEEQNIDKKIVMGEKSDGDNSKQIKTSDSRRKKKVSEVTDDGRR